PTAPPPIPARASPSQATLPRTGNKGDSSSQTTIPRSSVPSKITDSSSGPIASGTTKSTPPRPATKSGPQFPRAGYDGPNAPFAIDAGLRSPPSSRAKRPSKPPSDAPTFEHEPHTPAVIVDESLTIPDPIPDPIPKGAKQEPPKRSP